MKIIRTIYGQEVTIELTKEEVYCAHLEEERNYFRESILRWAEEHGKKMDDELLGELLRQLHKNYDLSSSLWNNISSNYNWIIYLRNK